MNEIDLLSHVYQTAEMGQDGITSVLKRSRDPSLNQALERQKREYHDLQASAGDMLRARGIQPDGVGAVAKLSSGMMSAMNFRSPSPVFSSPWQWPSAQYVVSPSWTS